MKRVADEHVTENEKASGRPEIRKNLRRDIPTEIPVTYALLSGSTTEETTRAYTEVFVNDEPMTHRHHIDPDTFLCHARGYIRFCADAQQSFIACAPLTGECAGFILCSDLATDFSCLGAEMATFLAFFPASVAIIDALEDAFQDREHIARGATLHVFQLGVRRSYRNQSIATNLIHRVLFHAKEQGFRHIVADCTGPVSRHTFERCGFIERGHIPYDTFSTGNCMFFAGLPGGISLMVRDL
jgi:GNAT superfamily N-acetyltransferase